MATYPAHRENDVVLRDGSTVHVRPARPDDAPAMERLLEGLSDRSRWLRFFSGFPNLERAVRWATDVDYEHRCGLVATTGDDGHLVGHAGWEREEDRPERAEVALEIVDAMQSKGLGTILLGQLAEAAHDAGVEVLEAEVLPENHLMIKVFRDCGFPVKTHAMPGVVLVEFPASLSPEARERFERREQVAATAAMRTFFSPRSVAVIGASRRRGTVAGELFHNLLAAGFHARCTRSTPGPRWSSPCWPTHRSWRCRARSTWPWWPCPRPWSWRPPERARPRGCGRWWSSRPASPRPGPRAANASASCWPSAGPPGCASSAPTAWGSSTPTHRCAWTPPSGRTPPSPGGWGSCPSRAPSAWPSSTTPTPSAWGCRRSCRSATRPTSPATTCSPTGSRTSGPGWCCCTWSRSGTRASSPASPAGWPGPSPCWRSRAAARPPAPGPPPPTPGPCWPPPTSPSTPCSIRRG
jgi:GNAT superfamily N-acetyltransferase